jgi:hypothetical protein
MLYWIARRNMYKSACKVAFPNHPSIPYTPKLRPTIAQTNSVPESVRLQARAPPNISVTVSDSSPLYGIPISAVENPPNKLYLPVIPGYPMPMTEVGTMSASQTTQRRALVTQILAQDKYDPDTRFTQYFPPKPVPYRCPDRVPTKDPRPSVRICQPIRTFQGSVAK